ncbi:MAG: hypothetical protein ABW318_26055 [Vicinamibacterales bacterium]
MNLSHRRRFGRTGAAVLVLLLALACSASAQGARPIVFPPNATALEGLPTVRVETTPEATTRRQLDSKESAASRLRIQIKDGSFYWSSRDDRSLTLTPAGEFMYLSSTEPGRYVRIRRLNDRLTYVEHLDTTLGTVTYWGELRVVVGR